VKYRMKDESLLKKPKRDQLKQAKTATPKTASISLRCGKRRRIRFRFRHSLAFLPETCSVGTGSCLSLLLFFSGEELDSLPGLQ
jgi:hypothetical protein